MEAEYGIYRQNGNVVWLCADHLAIRRDCHDEDARSITEDDAVHRRAVHLPRVECHDCECEGEIEPGDVDLDLYGEGDPKPMSELKASYDRLFRRNKSA